MGVDVNGVRTSLTNSGVQIGSVALSNNGRGVVVRGPGPNVQSQSWIGSVNLQNPANGVHVLSTQVPVMRPDGQGADVVERTQTFAPGSTAPATGWRVNGINATAPAGDPPTLSFRQNGVPVEVSAAGVVTTMDSLRHAALASGLDAGQDSPALAAARTEARAAVATNSLSCTVQGQNQQGQTITLQGRGDQCRIVPAARPAPTSGP